MSEEQKHEPINDVQQLYFELFRRVRYNLLDGESVVRDLIEWRDLWYSVNAIRLPFPSTQKNRLPISLSLLRTTRWNDWPADTLLIWTDDANLEQLQRLIEERWQASEVSVYVPEDEEMMFANFHDEHDRVLFVWWD
ncbi:MAG TPA: hypothetical protein VJ761_02675 [Ktedonobacteraceae bacterium]|nr:hypothetical protein [Ktedonobacteraceae bacterium]